MNLLIGRRFDAGALTSFCLAVDCPQTMTPQPELQDSAEKQASLKKPAEKKAAPKVKNSIWDTSTHPPLPCDPARTIT